MKNIFLILTAGACWEMISSHPESSLEDRRFPNRKMRIMSTLPSDQQSLIVQQLRSLCLLKPKGESADWTLGLQSSILQQISETDDTTEAKSIKKYLTDSFVNEAVSNCDTINSKNRKQGDNDDIFAGVQTILTNVFSGNLFGINESSVGIRSTEGVRTMMSNIMKNLLQNIGSAQQAVASGTANANLQNVGTGINNTGTATGTGNIIG